MKIAVLGAGYMGTAMAVVAQQRGHDVRLWGTWLDDDLIEACEQRRPHPRLELVVDLPTFRHARLAEAIAGAELVIQGVNSDGAVPVLTRAAPHLPDVPILSVTKGFLENAAGRMERLDLVVSERVGRPLRYVHAAGPAKAMEVARGVLTWMTFAGKDAALCRDAMGGGHLHVGTTDDLAGAEVCSALKNAYATGLGLWDGLVGVDAHNARAACFTQSIVEMRAIVRAAGGRDETVHGSPGVGDLHVTGAGGRNRQFGERVGRGKSGKAVAAEMAAENLLTEGYAAIATAHRFARERGVTETPLLDALFAIVWQDAPARETLTAVRLSV